MTPAERAAALLLFEELVAPAGEGPGAREAWRGESTEVRHEVASLLAIDDELEAAAHGCAVPAEVARVGSVLGRYRLREVLGEGGMSTVFAAERSDGEIERCVALKVLRPEVLSLETARGFENEKRVLAGLEHPAIARLYDAGRTREGRPFLVMELVRGTPIDRFCTARRLALRPRIELFLAVCAAVEHAHRHGVIHCDIKPGNVLVTDDGQPKLVDFGVARWVGGWGGTSVRQEARFGLAPLTPDYASPEQLLGTIATPASDLYSLGVLLHRLLSGGLPFAAAGLAPAAVARERLQAAPEPASATVRRRAREAGGGRAAAEHLARALEGDLDAILRRCLEVAPERRYATVRELAAELRRHLRHEPVLARRGGWRYRAALYARRHRWSLACVACLLALFASATLGVGWLSRELAQERALTTSTLELATDLLGLVAPAAPPPTSAREAHASLESALADRHANSAVVARAGPRGRTQVLSAAGPLPVRRAPGVGRRPPRPGYAGASRPLEAPVAACLADREEWPEGEVDVFAQAR